MIRRRYLPISDNRRENKKYFFCALVAVRGITGTGEAAGAGEFYKGKMEKIAGGCWGWDSVSVTWCKALDSGDAVVVLQSNRKAFDATLKDPEFLADAKKSRLNADPVPTEDIEKAVSALFKLDRDLAANLKDVLYN